ncbi:hypothetical protein AB7M47_007771 [Bradyrhizobium elkanii]
MGDQDMRHGLALDRIEHRLGMRLVVGTGIDDRDLALADDVADRAGEGERARIVAEDTANAGADLFDHAGLQREIAVERDVVVVGHGDFLCIVIPGQPDRAEPGISRFRVRC